jgi:hypothetical protein
MESAMTDSIVHQSNAASRDSRIAYGMRRLLDELPDAVLKDIGLTRGDIPYVVGKLVPKRRKPARAPDRFDWNAVWRNATMLRLPDTLVRLAVIMMGAVSVGLAVSSAVFS